MKRTLKASFSHQQRGLSSELSPGSAQALEAQRHTLIQEAATEMMRRDADNAEMLSQFRSELRFHRLQTEGWSDEFQHYQSELRQQLDRSSTESSQFRSLCEETKTANALITPDVVRLQVREAQQYTRVSTLQNQETELQGQLQNLRQAEARVNNRMPQIKIHEYKAPGINAAVTEVQYRNRLNLPKIETQKIFQIRRKKTVQ